MKSAIYLRTSTTEQNPENQRAEIEAYCQSKGMEITGEYIEQESAWKAGHQAELSRLLHDLRSGNRKYDYLVVWSIDRLSREGVGKIFQLFNTFEALKCKVNSVKEPFVNDDTGMRDPILAVIAWVAQFESKRRSERVRAGLAKARQEGKPIGKRGKDNPNKPRHKSGYHLRYAGKV